MSDTLRVRLPVSSVSGFVLHHGRMVTTGGVFLPTARPLPVGARVAFRLELESGASLLQGEGVVRWVRGAATPADPSWPAGMGVQFDTLDAASREVLGVVTSVWGPAAHSDEPPARDFMAESAAVEGPAPVGPGGPSGAPRPPTIAPVVAGAQAAGGRRTPTPVRRGATPAPVRGTTPAPVRGTTPAPVRARPERVGPMLDLDPVPAQRDEEIVLLDESRGIGVPAVAAQEESFAGLGEERAAPPRLERKRKAAAKVEDTSITAEFEIPQSIIDLAMTVTTTAGAPAAVAASAPVVPAVRPTPVPAPPRFGDVDDLRFTPVLAPVEAAQAPVESVQAPVEPVQAPVEPVSATSKPVVGSAESQRASGAAAVALPSPGPGVTAAPTASQALTLPAALRARKGDPAQAEAELQRAIAEAPADALLRFELGRVYLAWTGPDGKDHDGAAEAAFARAVELDPDLEEAHVALGQVRLRRKLVREAEATFRRALQRWPSSDGARAGLALASAVRWRSRAWRGSTALAGLVLVGLNVWVLMGREPAPAPAAVGTPPPAVAVQAAAPTALPVHAPATTTTAPASAAVAVPPAHAVAQAPAGAPPATPAVSPAPERSAPAAAHAVAAASTKETQPASARASPRPRVARSAAQPQATASTEAPAAKSKGAAAAAALVKAGDAALRGGRPDEALASFQKALQADPRHAPALRGLGSVYLMQGDDAKAAESYRKYLQMAPGAADAARIQALVAGL